MTNPIITLAVVNFFPQRGEVEKNAARIGGYIRAAGRRGADLVLFPELALTGYCDEKDTPLAEKMQVKNACSLEDGPVLALRRAAEEAGVYALFGAPEKAGETVYNAAFVCCPDGRALTYRKLHPFAEENRWCSPGDSPLLLDTPFGKMGVGICHDTYSFPELPRYYAAQGAKLYLNLTALSSINTWDDFYRTTLQSLVIQTGMFVASANLCGSDLSCNFPGGSLVMGPSLGWLMGKEYPYCHVYAGGVGCFEQEMFLATIDLSRALPGVFAENPATSRPDFRPERYAAWYGELAGNRKEGAAR